MKRDSFTFLGKKKIVSINYIKILEKVTNIIKSKFNRIENLHVVENI